MIRLLSTYLLVLLLLSLGFFGIGALASAAELRDPMMPPPFALQKMRRAKLGEQPPPPRVAVEKPAPKTMQLTSILFANDRKVAIIDDQMLAVGDRIHGAELIELTRDSARLLRKGKVIKLRLATDTAAIKKKPVKGDL